MQKLKKEHGELKQRLTALKQGTAFLNNLTALNRKYLQHRSTHTDELETVSNYNQFNNLVRSYIFEYTQEFVIAKGL